MFALLQVYDLDENGVVSRKNKSYQLLQRYVGDQTDFLVQNFEAFVFLFITYVL